MLFVHIVMFIYKVMNKSGAMNLSTISGFRLMTKMMYNHTPAMLYWLSIFMASVIIGHY